VTTPHDWLRALAGKFIVFEGPDGSGKTTQLKRLSALCREHAIPVQEVREPGGTPIGERIRQILLDKGSDMNMRCEMLLYMASRAQLVEQIIRPALRDHQVVLADRFVSSTLAYQGAAGGLPILDIQDVAKVATGGIRPDLVVICDVDDETALRRMSPLLAPGRDLDRIESRSREFHKKVRQGYLTQAKADPHRHLVLDASKPPDEVWAELLAEMPSRVW
jgi:dTMP kinase